MDQALGNNGDTWLGRVCSGKKLGGDKYPFGRSLSTRTKHCQNTPMAASATRTQIDCETTEKTGIITRLVHKPRTPTRETQSCGKIRHLTPSCTLRHEYDPTGQGFRYRSSALRVLVSKPTLYCIAVRVARSTKNINPPDRGFHPTRGRYSC